MAMKFRAHDTFFRDRAGCHFHRNPALIGKMVTSVQAEEAGRNPGVGALSGLADADHICVYVGDICTYLQIPGRADTECE